MGEEVRMSEYQTTANGGGAEHEERVMEWEMGLPAADDLTPLSQPLIPPELASAFSISMEPCRTLLDVTRASQTTLSNLHLNTSSSIAGNNFKSFTTAAAGTAAADHCNEPMVVEEEEEGEEDEEEVEDEDISPGADQDGSGSDTRNNKLRRIDSEEADSAARTLKRPRLVWTPQLHKRFVDVVAHLGIKNAVPKTIMQLMNVEGLTRENVASHLQKYRMYLKRMQGFSSSEGGAVAGPAAAAASSSDQLFASTPVPQSLNETHGSGNGNGNMGMPIQTMAYHHHHHHPMGMLMYGNVGMQHNHHQYQNGFDHGNFNYGNGYGSGGAFPHHNHHHHHPHHVGSNDNNVM